MAPIKLPAIHEYEFCTTSLKGKGQASSNINSTECQMSGESVLSFVRLSGKIAAIYTLDPSVDIDSRELAMVRSLLRNRFAAAAGYICRETVHW